MSAKKIMPSKLPFRSIANVSSTEFLPDESFRDDTGKDSHASCKVERLPGKNYQVSAAYSVGQKSETFMQSYPTHKAAVTAFNDWWDAFVEEFTDDPEIGDLCVMIADWKYPIELDPPDTRYELDMEALERFVESTKSSPDSPAETAQ